ncbi:MAG: phytoene/squalene synthase family protein [Candidatus Kapaibacterium sp.]
MLNLSKEEIIELTAPSGGRFACRDKAAAYAFCEKLTKSHYENFPVGSALLPKDKRRHFYPIYIFSRAADDIADEFTETPAEERIGLLESMAGLIRAPDSNRSNPLFIALNLTRQELDIPAEPFLKLLKAFKMDVEFRQPINKDDLNYYCAHSANPVGELVLRIFGRYNEESSEYSDDICTGLQLVNFWQDISVDVHKGRCYIPKDVLKMHGLDETNYLNSDKRIELAGCLSFLYDYTEIFFKNGSKLINYLNSKRLKAEIALTIEGGRLILQKLKKMGPEVAGKRPKLTKADAAVLLLRTFIRHKVI